MDRALIILTTFVRIAPLTLLLVQIARGSVGPRRGLCSMSADLSRFGKTIPNVWLYKADPEEYSIHDLEKEPEQRDMWDGVRNYVARNHMRAAKLDDLVLLYHSNSKKETGIVGVAKIVREAYDDPTAMEPGDPHYDPKWQAKDGKCRWSCVDIKLLEKWEEGSGVTLIQLKEEKETNKVIASMQLFTSARLSVQAVELEAFERIESMRLENLSRVGDSTSLEPAKKKARKG